MVAEDGGDLFAERVLEALHGGEVEHFREASATREAAGDSDEAIRGASGGEGRRDGDERQFAGFRRLADLDAIAQSREQFADGGKFHEMEMHEAAAQDEGANGLRIALLLPGEDLAEHGKRVSGGVSHD